MKNFKIAKKNVDEGNLSFENFEAYWISAIGPTLYKKFVDEYSKKMWKDLRTNFINEFG